MDAFSISKRYIYFEYVYISRAKLVNYSTVMKKTHFVVQYK